MRQIDHFISGGTGASASRFGDIMDPNNGGVQARVALGDAAVLERAVQAALGLMSAFTAAIGKSLRFIPRPLRAVPLAAHFELVLTFWSRPCFVWFVVQGHRWPT